MNILFLCIANSARSQLAEALAKSLFPKNVMIESAGSLPSGIVQPFAIEVLKELDIDISKNFSKSIEQLSPEFLKNLDYVITLCAEEICPKMLTHAVRLHWPLQDPVAAGQNESAQAFRVTRDEIIEKLKRFGIEKDLI